MAEGLPSRFEHYCGVLVESLQHADRGRPARWYLQGLILPGGRKSVEPMAARVHPQNVRRAHQSMHHLVADSDWSDTAWLRAVAQAVVPALTGAAKRSGNSEPCYWIIDDTGMPKKGVHSVGVARQYCGQLGKTENCRVAVSLSLATGQGSLPLYYQLYLPSVWTDDPARCEAAGVPADTRFQSKGQIARTQIEAALAAGTPRGPVLADAAYGDEAAFRDWLGAQGLAYAVGIRPATTVWWGQAHQALPLPSSTTKSTLPDTPKRRGKLRAHLARDQTHQPIAVSALALKLANACYQSVTWRQGTNIELSARCARVRVRAAHRDEPRGEEWLIIEWPEGEPEPTRYWFSTLLETVSFEDLMHTIKARWRIERDYQELKQELGLGHYEGRNWRGFHHHASLCIAAYGFLMKERLSGVKKNAARFTEPPVPEAFRPRGSLPDAASSAALNRNPAISPRERRRSAVDTGLLRQKKRLQGASHLITQ